MRRLLVSVVVLVAAVCATADAKVGDIRSGRTLVVIGQSGVERADAVADATGREPAGAMWYLGIHEGAAIQPVLDDMAAAVRSHRGLIPNVGVSFGAISTPSPSYAAAIAAGAYDDTIVRLADGLKRMPTVVYLRIGYEFDLLGGQYGPPEVFKAAYRRVVDVLRAEGVRNAAYVWHSAGAFWRGTDPSLFAAGSGAAAAALDDALPAAAADPQPITAFYPGRDYVDAFGISYWQDSCCFGRSGDAARAEYEERTREILTQAAAMRLPLHISESTPVYVGADSGDESVEWIENTFRLIEDFDIRMLNLISIDWQEGGFFAAPFWNGYWPDARIHHFADTRAAYLHAVADDRYVFRSRKLPRRLGLRGG